MTDDPDFWGRQERTIQLLKGLEAKMGGVEKMSAICKRLGDDHPRIWQAFVAYLKAFTLLVECKGITVELAIDTIASAMQTCFTDEGLLIIEEELKLLGKNPSPEALKTAETRLSALLDQLGAPILKLGAVQLPADVADQLSALAGVKVRKLNPSTKKDFTFTATGSKTRH